MSEDTAGTDAFRCPAGHPLAGDTMLKYFLSTLQVRLDFIEPNVNPDRQKVFDEARNELAEFFKRHTGDRVHIVDDAWTTAYRLERSIALIEPAENLIGEVRRRLDEAAEEGVSSAARLRTEYEIIAQFTIDTTTSPPSLKPGGESVLRGRLLDVLEELHWHYQRKFHSRPIQKEATTRLVLMGLGACALFVLPYFYLYLKDWWNGPDVTLPLADWAWLPLLTALTAGFFGAMFSRLLYLQTNWNTLSLGALKDARDPWSIVLRGAVGMSGAIVVYFFLQSNIVSGELFPKFAELGLDQANPPSRKVGGSEESEVPLRLILPNADLALLVVWSFLAGFSERLVPGILQSTENSLAEASRRPPSITR